MLTKNELKTMLKSAESYRIERTVSTTNTDKFGQAICALTDSADTAVAVANFTKW